MVHTLSHDSGPDDQEGIKVEVANCIRLKCLELDKFDAGLYKEWERNNTIDGVEYTCYSVWLLIRGNPQLDANQRREISNPLWIGWFKLVPGINYDIPGYTPLVEESLAA